MTFLDSSAIIDMLEGREETVAYLDDKEPFFTSAICVYEVLDDNLGTGSTDPVAERNQFGGVRTLDLTDGVALEAVRLQDRLMADGDRMSARDVMIAATARSTGDELVVSDADFETEHLQDVMDVTNLRT